MPTSVKIDFLIPGFSKCGTTTLCALLDQHPDIYIPTLKELWYFSSDDFESKHQHYDNHFAPAASKQLKGEGSVGYSGAEYEDISVERIHINISQCKFIFIARNPRDRIESSYREMHNSGAQYGFNAPFALGECLASFPQMINDTMYWQRIGKYRQRFGDGPILVLFLEELMVNFPICIQRCFEHLGVDPQACPRIDDTRLNEGQTKLFDTRLLRYLRNNRYTGLRLARIAPFEQDRFLVPLKLRRPFGDRPVHWDEKALEYLTRDIYPDARAFLEFYNKAPSFWGLDTKV